MDKKYIFVNLLGRSRVKDSDAFITRLQKREPMLSSPGAPLILGHIYLEVIYGPGLGSIQ